MGSPADWSAMTAFVAGHGSGPSSAMSSRSSGGEAFDLMERGGQFGKIVVRI
jgi:zinc-binding alcohol dehydrogenase/oxidoreductase